MTRRGFLGAFAATAALDPERLLWRPGAKLISIPKPISQGDLLAELNVVTLSFFHVNSKALNDYIFRDEPMLDWIRRTGLATGNELLRAFEEPIRYSDAEGWHG